MARKLNELFGQGFVTLEYLTERMPAHVFTAWAAFVAEYERLADKRKADADWQTALDQAKRTLRHR